MVDEPQTSAQILPTTRPTPWHYMVVESGAIGCCGCLALLPFLAIVSAVIGGLGLPEPMAYSSMLGAVGALYSLLGIWLGFGNAPLWARALGVMVAQGCLLLLALLEPRLLAVTLIPLAISLPCAACRLVGFELIETDARSAYFVRTVLGRPSPVTRDVFQAGPVERQGGQFTLRNLFALTTLLAFVALILKVTGAAQQLMDDPRATALLFLGLAVQGLIACGCAFAVLWPTGRVVLRAVGCVIVSGLLGYMVGAPLLNDWVAESLVVSTTAAMATITCLVLWYFRLLGFRLIRLQRLKGGGVDHEPPPSEPPSPFEF